MGHAYSEVLLGSGEICRVSEPKRVRYNTEHRIFHGEAGNMATASLGVGATSSTPDGNLISGRPPSPSLDCTPETNTPLKIEDYILMLLIDQTNENEKNRGNETCQVFFCVDGEHEAILSTKYGE